MYLVQIGMMRSPVLTARTLPKFSMAGGGNDTIDGGGGYDRADYNLSMSAVNVILGGLGTGTAIGDTSVGTDMLISIEGVRGSAFADVLTGSNDADVLREFTKDAKAMTPLTV